MFVNVAQLFPNGFGKGCVMGFRLGLAQCCHPSDGDVVAMADKWACRASDAGVDFLVFPESLMTPFELSDADFAEEAQAIDGPFCTAMDALAAKYGLWMAYTVNERSGAPACSDVPSGVSRPYNTAVIVGSDGVKRSVYRKVHLFDTDFVRESDKITPGSELVAPVQAPFGSIGVAICYDLRFPELARAAASAGCQVLVYASAWVDGPRKVDQWRTLLAARAIENEMYVAGLSRCDRGFGQTRRDYAGNSCIFGPLGEEVASARGIEEELLVADIDPAALDAARAAMPALDHRRVDLY